MSIPGLRGLSVRVVAKRTFDEYLEDDLLTYAAALSYHVFFALFPFVLFLLALLSFLRVPGLFDYLLGQAGELLPPDAMRQVRDVIGEIRGQSRGGLLSLGILGSIWVASVGVRSTMNALNRAYDAVETRSRLRRYSLSVLWTVGLALLVTLAALLMTVGPGTAAWLGSRVGLGGVVLEGWRWLRLPTAALLAMLAVSLVYQVAPCVEQRFRLISPGSVLTVLLWGVASYLFTLYTTHFGRYSVTYGSVGAVIVLLTYLFLLSAVMLLGAEVNAVVQQARPAPGDPQPTSPAPHAARAREATANSR